LAGAAGNKAEAARLLGMARSTFLSRMKKHGLFAEQWGLPGGA
jgi:transcriptional regulator of acetoin/glycerol metabolism